MCGEMFPSGGVGDPALKAWKDYAGPHADGSYPSACRNVQYLVRLLSRGGKS